MGSNARKVLIVELVGGSNARKVLIVELVGGI